MSPLQQEIVGASALVAFFFLVTGSVEYAIRREKVTPEVARKMVHLIGGLGCLLFPFLLASRVTVGIIAVVFMAVFFFGERCATLKSLSCVERKSYGSVYFPAAVFFVFVVSGSRLWLYFTTLLVLILADTAAALTGGRFGRIYYETGPGERKSLEGSLAFFGVSVLAVFGVLYGMSDFSPGVCVVTALLSAVLLACLEAVSVGGTDNIFVPLGACFLLLKITTKTPYEIAFQTLCLGGVALLFVAVNRWRRLLQTRLLILSILALYAAWTLGSAEWMLAALAGFAVYNGFCLKCESIQSGLTAFQMLRPFTVALVILFWANITMAFDFWFAPFVIANSSSVSYITIKRRQIDKAREALTGAPFFLALCLPGVLSLLFCATIQGIPVLRAAFWIMPICVVTPVLGLTVDRCFGGEGVKTCVLFLVGAAAALAGSLLQVAGVVDELVPTKWLEVF